MRLNTIRPGDGAKKVAKRVGRGIGSGLGKTCGRGHKGQKSRAGGFHKVGFEGGQMPIQRRLPKRGFKSRRIHETAEVTLAALERLSVEQIDIEVLKQNGLVPAFVKKVKVIASGEISRAVSLKDIKASKGAKKILEAAGGKLL